MVNKSDGQKPDQRRLNKTLTIYGRNPVFEAFRTPSLTIDRLHLARSNKPSRQLADLQSECEQRGIPVVEHDRKALSRISRNGKQDQGIAADIFCPQMQAFNDWLDDSEQPLGKLRVIALEGITNPQNLGMCIRSCHGAGIDAILLSSKGSSSLNPLVIKASAGTAYTAPLVLCADMPAAVAALAARGANAYVMRADADQCLYDESAPTTGVFILGNETEGVSDLMSQIASQSLGIPLREPVESLNVAVTAALVAYAVCHQNSTT